MPRRPPALLPHAEPSPGQVRFGFHVYDLTGGLAGKYAKHLPPSELAVNPNRHSDADSNAPDGVAAGDEGAGEEPRSRPLTAIYHSAIVAYGYEYYFEGGVGRSPEGATRFGPNYRYVSGAAHLTTVTRPVFERWAQLMTESAFGTLQYDPLDHNCHHFCNAASLFLSGGSAEAPAFILDNLDTLLRTSIARTVAPLVARLTAGVVGEIGALNDDHDMAAEAAAEAAVGAAQTVQIGGVDAALPELPTPRSDDWADGGPAVRGAAVGEERYRSQGGDQLAAVFAKLAAAGVEAAAPDCDSARGSRTSVGGDFEADSASAESAPQPPPPHLGFCYALRAEDFLVFSLLTLADFNAAAEADFADDGFAGNPVGPPPLTLRGFAEEATHPGRWSAAALATDSPSVVAAIAEASAAAVARAHRAATRGPAAEAVARATALAAAGDAYPTPAPPPPPTALALIDEATAAAQVLLDAEGFRRRAAVRRHGGLAAAAAAAMALGTGAGAGGTPVGPTSDPDGSAAALGAVGDAMPPLQRGASDSVDMADTTCIAPELLCVLRDAVVLLVADPSRRSFGDLIDGLRLWQGLAAASPAFCLLTAHSRRLLLAFDRLAFAFSSILPVEGLLALLRLTANLLSGSPTSAAAIMARADSVATLVGKGVAAPDWRLIDAAAAVANGAVIASKFLTRRSLGSDLVRRGANGTLCRTVTLALHALAHALPPLAVTRSAPERVVSAYMAPDELELVAAALARDDGTPRTGHQLRALIGEFVTQVAAPLHQATAQKLLLAILHFVCAAPQGEWFVVGHDIQYNHLHTATSGGSAVVSGAATPSDIVVSRAAMAAMTAVGAVERAVDTPEGLALHQMLMSVVGRRQASFAFNPSAINTPAEY